MLGSVLGFETVMVNKISSLLVCISKLTMAVGPGVEVFWGLQCSTWKSCRTQVFELGLEGGMGIHQLEDGERVFQAQGTACAKSQR